MSPAGRCRFVPGNSDRGLLAWDIEIYCSGNERLMCWKALGGRWEFVGQSASASERNVEPGGRHNRSEARQGLVEDKENAEPAKAGGIKRCPTWRQRFMPPYRLRSGLLYFLRITRGSAATRLRPSIRLYRPPGSKFLGLSALQLPIYCALSANNAAIFYRQSNKRRLCESYRVARSGSLVCVYVSGRDAQGRFFVYARILSRKGLEPGLVMG